jgi:hypothetical protein
MTVHDHFETALSKKSRFKVSVDLRCTCVSGSALVQSPGSTRTQTSTE